MTISIHKIGNTTQVRFANNNKSKRINSNSNREIVIIDDKTVMIVADPNENVLNNFKIKVDNLTNDGVDFTGINSANLLLDKLASEQLFKQGGGGVTGGEEIYNILNPNSFSNGNRVQGFLTPNIWIDGYYLTGEKNEITSYLVLEQKTIYRAVLTNGSKTITSVGFYFTDYKTGDTVTTIHGEFIITAITDADNIEVSQAPTITDNSTLFSIKEI